MFRSLTGRLTGLFLAVASIPAIAATPDSGTISTASGELNYTFPAAALANASGAVETNYMCDVTFPCDEFALTVDLPADYLEQFPDAAIRVAAAADIQDLDIDLQVSDEAGNVVYNYRDNPPAQPSLLIYPAGGVQKFIVQVVPGTPHTGGSVVITLQPGDEAKSLGLFGGSLGLGLLAPFALAGLRRRVLAGAALALVSTGSIAAVEPASGVITDTNPIVEFSGGPHVVPNVTNLVQEADEDTVCEEGTPTCDVFRFEVNLTDVNVDEDQLIITVGWNDPIPEEPSGEAPKMPDYDLELFDDVTGKKIQQQATGDNPEIMVTLPGNGKYQLRIIPYLDMNEPYTGKIQFVPYVEEESKSLAFFGGALGAGGLALLAGLGVLMRVRRG